MPITPDMAERLVAANNKARVAERNALIRQACAEGGSTREIADLVGLSAEAVRKIAAP